MSTHGNGIFCDDFGDAANKWVVRIPIMTDEGIGMPRPSNGNAPGVDVSIADSAILYPHSRRQVRTGLRVSIPRGYIGLCFPQAILASRLGVGLSSCVAIISPGDHKEVMADLENKSEHPVRLRAGERVFQLVVMPHPVIEFVPVDNFAMAGSEDGDPGKVEG